MPKTHLGLYGAFGYDLCSSSSPCLCTASAESQRDLVLYPDELTVVDRRREQAICYRYDFTFGSASSEGKPPHRRHVDLQGGRRDSPVQ